MNPGLLVPQMRTALSAFCGQYNGSEPPALLIAFEQVAKGLSVPLFLRPEFFNPTLSRQGHLGWCRRLRPFFVVSESLFSLNKPYSHKVTESWKLVNRYSATPVPDNRQHRECPQINDCFPSWRSKTSTKTRFSPPNFCREAATKPLRFCPPSAFVDRLCPQKTHYSRPNGANR